MWCMDRRKLGVVWTTVVLAVCVLQSAGCALGRDAPRDLGDMGLPEETTLIVVNTGIDALAIYASGLSARVGTVMPGSMQCIRIPDSLVTQRLTAEPVGGGQPIVSPSFELRPGDGWSWSIGMNQVANRLSLTPSRQCVQM